MDEPISKVPQLAPHQWKKGQSGNPGGISKEARALMDANALAALRIHAAMLAQMETEIANTGGVEITSEHLTLAKHAQDRGLGAPTQPVNVEADIKTEDSGVAKLTALLDAIAGRTIGKPESE